MVSYTASLDFRPELFDDPREYEEVPLRDRKRDFPDLTSGREKSRFIERVIALANTARRYGRSAYYLYGLDDSAQPYGLESSIEPYGSPDEIKTWETARRRIKEQIVEYVDPLVDWSFEHGEKEGHKVAYLQVNPVRKGPFRVRTSLGALQPGQSWIRIGESKHPVCPTGDEYWYAASEVPYVLPSDWQAYFEGLWNDSMTNLSKAQNIVAYQELFTADGHPLQDVVRQFLASDNVLLILSGAAGCGKSAFLQRLVGQWATDSAAAVAGIRSRKEFSSPPEWIPVYLSLRGRGVTATWSLAQVVLDKVNQMSHSALWERRPAHPERLLEYKDLHWLVCLDGLDEIWRESGRNHFLASLQVFLERYPRVKVILATRPDVSRGVLEGRGDVVDIAPLTPDQILHYIQNFPGAEDPESYNEIEAFLRSEHELWRLCQAPAHLEAAVTVLVGAYPQPLEESAALAHRPMSDSPAPIEPIVSAAIESIPIADIAGLVLEEPSEVREAFPDEPDEPEDVTLPIPLGVLLERVYQHLWEREQGRHSYQPQRWNAWLEQTRHLALRMDGEREFIAYEDVYRFFRNNEVISRLLSVGILKQEAPETWIGFVTQLTKLYFAAAFLKPYIEQVTDHRKVRRHIKETLPDFRQRLLEILSDISNVNPSPIFQEVNDESV